MSRDAEQTREQSEIEKRRAANRARDLEVMRRAYAPAERDDDGKVVKQARCVAHQKFEIRPERRKRVEKTPPTTHAPFSSEVVEQARRERRKARKKLARSMKAVTRDTAGRARPVGQSVAKLIRHVVRAAYDRPEARQPVEQGLRAAWSRMPAHARGELARGWRSQLGITERRAERRLGGGR